MKYTRTYKFLMACMYLPPLVYDWILAIYSLLNPVMAYSQHGFPIKFKDLIK